MQVFVEEKCRVKKNAGVPKVQGFFLVQDLSPSARFLAYARFLSSEAFSERCSGERYPSEWFSK